jgi:hypothetical protein
VKKIIVCVRDLLLLISIMALISLVPCFFVFTVISLVGAEGVRNKTSLRELVLPSNCDKIVDVNIDSNGVANVIYVSDVGKIIIYKEDNVEEKVSVKDKNYVLNNPQK